MEIDKAKAIAEQVVNRLTAHCQRIEVAGSIRRRRPEVHDIDLVLIPSDRDAVDRILMQVGKIKMSGLKIARVTMESIELDVYYATPETWATLLLVRTGSEQFNRMLANRALKRGLKLKAGGQGVMRGLDVIASESEEQILGALGLPYLG
jgi:DNA polymerase (family 10)